jgi:hypothetical protein
MLFNFSRIIDSHVLKLLKNVQSEPKLNSSNCLNYKNKY